MATSGTPERKTKSMAADPRDDEVYVDEPWLRLHWDSAQNCVISEWKAFANSAEFRAGVMKGLQAVREKHATGWVSDARKVKVIVHEDQKWANEVVVPLLAATGLKRMGVVTARTGLGKVSVEEVLRQVDDKTMQVCTFDSISAALSWAGKA
jgi:hypothetical protein